VRLAYSPTSVYIARDDAGTVLYVGASSNVSDRMRRHRYQSAWFAQMSSLVVNTYPDWYMGRLAEKQAIRQYLPQFNRVRYERQTNAYEYVTQIARSAEHAQRIALVGCSVTAPPMPKCDPYDLPQAVAS